MIATLAALLAVLAALLAVLAALVAVLRATLTAESLPAREARLVMSATFVPALLLALSAADAA
jgi:hypothetical protein